MFIPRQDKGMRLIRYFLVAMIVALVAMAWVKKTYADEVWKNWGAAPFATNQAEACKKAFGAINAFALPSEVRKHFKQVVGDTCNGGTLAWLPPNAHLNQMWSGGKKAKVMNDVTVAELPVAESPSGRPYRKGSVAETVRTLSWKYEYEGKTYVLYLPLVCFNWSWKVEEFACATVKSTVKPGDPVRFAVLTQKLLPASACWQLCDGDVCTALPSPCDTCNWVGPKSVIPAGYEPLHTGKYIAKYANQSLRFPVEVKANYVALCDERDGAESDADVVTPEDWQGKSVHHVPATWPMWGTTQKGSYQLPGN